MLNIISVPDPVLRQKSKPIPDLDSSTITFIEDLIQTLLHKTDPPGVGISAVQVGKLDRIFITYLPRDPLLPSRDWKPENLEIKVYINPTITKKSKKRTLGGRRGRPFLEGCLSIPKLWGPVPRHEWVELTYLTLATTPGVETSATNILEKTERFKSFPARVIQHEFDHLEGILFTDYTLEKNLPLYFEDGSDFVEITNPPAIIKW